MVKKSSCDSQVYESGYPQRDNEMETNENIKRKELKLKIKAMAIMVVLCTFEMTFANLVSNGSFESPYVNGMVWNNAANISNWSTAPTQDSNTLFFGTLSSILAVDGQQMVGLRNYIIYQYPGVSIEEGKDYTLTAYARYAGSGTTHFQLRGVRDFRLLAESTFSTELADWTTTPNVSVTYTGQAADAGDSLLVWIYEESVDSGVFCWIDQVSLQAGPPAAAPIFSPWGSEISGPTDIAISSTTQGVSIYYTLNGETPTTGSTLYAGTPVRVNPGDTLQAIAVADGYTNSPVTSRTYKIAHKNSATNGSFESPDVNGAMWNSAATINNWSTAPNNDSNTLFFGTLPSMPAVDGQQMVGLRNYTLYQHSGISIQKDTVYTLTAYARYEGSGTTHFQLRGLRDFRLLAEGTFSTELAEWSTTPNVSVTYLGQAADVGDSLQIWIYEESVDSGVFCWIDQVSLTVEPPAAAPIFSPWGSEISGPTDIAISSTTQGASIYYTLNGGAPTTASLRYGGSVRVNPGDTLQAIVVADGYAVSPVTSRTYIYKKAFTNFVTNGSFESPDVNGVMWNSAATISNWSTASTQDSNTLFFGTHSSMPAVDGQQMVGLRNYALYQHPGVSIQKDAVYTLRAYARYDGAGTTHFQLRGVRDFRLLAETTFSTELTEWSTTPNVTVTYQGQAVDAGDTLLIWIYEESSTSGVFCWIDQVSLMVEPPTSAPIFSPAKPYISGSTPITITCSTSGAKIYYTTNGETPTSGNSLYTGSPITVNNGTILKAIAVADGYVDSPVTSRTYIYDPVRAGLTRGHYLLIDKGLQIQAMVFPRLEDTWETVGFNRTQFANTNFTTVNFWSNTDCNLYLGDAATCLSWSRKTWHDTDVRDTLSSQELLYADKMVSFQYRDEINVSDTNIQTSVASWFGLVHNAYPNIIAYTNQSGSQISFVDMQAYMSATCPDMVMFDDYPFSGNIIGGSPTTWYGYVQKYRRLGLAGNDGTGTNPIPYALYTQTYSRDGHTPSESELCLNEFAAWAFGYKFVTAYTYDSPSSTSPGYSIFFAGLGDANPVTAKVNEISEINRQSRNLGPALVRLLSTDVRMIMGEHAVKTLGVIIRTDPNSTPDGITTGLSGADTWLTSVSATNLGSINDSKRGDVIVGFFKPLHESFDGDKYSNQQYFMVVNGLSDVSGSASQTQQRVRLTFNMGSSGITSLQRLNRNTGTIEVVPLVSEGGGIYHLDLVLNGGTGDLFKYNTGAPFVGVTKTSLIPGDANGDNMVDVGDLGILAANYGGTNKIWAQGDFNGDGAVDVGDLGILAANYGKGSANSSDFEADYAKTFGTATQSDDVVQWNNTICSGLGLPLIAGLLLIGFMLVKSEE